MTHSAVAGYSDDTPNQKCYGWNNSAKCHLSENAGMYLSVREIATS